MINLIDGNNYFRRLIEYGGDARSIFNSHFNPPKTTIIAWDGEKGSSRRRKIYPQYKTNRGPLDKDISVQFNTLIQIFRHCNVAEIFHNALMDVLNQINQVFEAVDKYGRPVMPPVLEGEVLHAGH